MFLENPSQPKLRNTIVSNESVKCVTSLAPEQKVEDEKEAGVNVLRLFLVTYKSASHVDDSFTNKSVITEKILVKVQIEILYDESKQFGKQTQPFYLLIHYEFNFLSQLINERLVT